MARIGDQNWAFFAAIRAPNAPSSEDDILLKISPDLSGNRGRPMGLLNGPFLLANRGKGRAKFRVNYGPL